jgi:hypothetical protein
MFRSPAPRFHSVSAGNSPQPMISPQLAPPSGPPFPGYDAFSDRFNTFASMHDSPRTRPKAGSSTPHMPYGMQPPVAQGNPDGSIGGFNSSMLLQNAAPMQRRGNMYQPQHSAPSNSRAPPTYPYATYPPNPMSQYPTSPYLTNARSPQGTPSPTFSDFGQLNQLPRY